MINKIKNTISKKGFKKYFFNTGWLFFEKVLRIITGIFLGAWVARYLGTEDFGIINYSRSFVGLFIALSTLGLDNIVIKRLVKNESNEFQLIGTAFFLKIMGALLVLFSISILLYFTSGDSQINYFILIIACSTLFQSFNVYDFYFQSKVLSRFVVYSNISTLTISSILKILFIYLEMDLICFIYIILLESIILSFGLVYFFSKNKSQFLDYFSFKLPIAKSLLKESWPLILSGIVISVYMKVDQVMIKELLGLEFVGKYSAAVRLSEAWYFIPLIVTSSLFPSIIKSGLINKEKYYSRLQKLFNFMVLISLSVAIPMTFLSDWIIITLYGKEYLEAGTVLAIHIWTGLFVALGLASGKWLINENLQHLSFYRTLVGAVFNVVLNLFLIPSYGIIGAAFSTLIAQILAAYIVDLFHKRTRKIFIMKTKSIFLINNFR